MNWLDILLAAVVVGSVATALAKGIARETIALISLAAALIAGVWFYGIAAAALKPYLPSKPAAGFAGFFLIFGIVILAGMLAGWFASHVLKTTGLSWMDRLLGGLFGFVRGLCLATIIVMAFMAFSRERPPRAVAQSRLAPYFAAAAHTISAMAPREFKEDVRANYDRLKKFWHETWRKKPQPEDLPAQKI